MVGRESSFTERGILRLQTPTGEIKEVEGWIGTAEQLSIGCDALLSRFTLSFLDVDMNFHIRNCFPFPRLRTFRQQTEKKEKKMERKNKILNEHVSSQTSEKMERNNKIMNEHVSSQTSPEFNELSPIFTTEFGERLQGELSLGESKIRDYLERRSADLTSVKHYSLNDIKIYKDHPSHLQIEEGIRNAVLEYESVFADSDGLPRPLDHEPHVIRLKPGAQPTYCPEPRWTPAYRRYSELWALKVLRSGLYERSNSSWASRIHLALKAARSTIRR